MELPDAPRKLTRIIIRTVDTQEVEHINDAKLLVFKVRERKLGHIVCKSV
jgi:hypothetical protein